MTGSTLSITKISCTPYSDQRPGTAGLRKRVKVIEQPHYLATFVEALFRALRFPPGSSLVVGGDGRYYNDRAIQTIAGIAAAHGIARLIVGQHGILSTPAASHLIRLRQAAGGLLLTASHNPGGPDGDFGLKFNTATGGQAPEQLSEAVYAESQRITEYRIVSLPPLQLGRIGTAQLGPLTLEIVDPTLDYVRLMQQLFDFDCISAYIGAGARVRFDALHGVTGPYAKAIFVDTLGLPAETVLHGDPLPDFGGLHPDPNPVDAGHLVALAMGRNPPDLLAASDGDGDRNMILGSGFFLSPCDSVAVMLAHAKRIPGYRDGVPGVARSMPTSRALDRVAAAMGLPCYETPTGWRFFCNLLEAGLVGLCGEESFGTSSAHVREKDGLWAVLFWLNLLAELRQPLAEILQSHWSVYGRHYYQRHDYVISDASRAQALIRELRQSLPRLNGRSLAGSAVNLADEFAYHDPVDHSESTGQGIRIVTEGGARMVYRLSGTGTAGATLRVYLEQFEQRPERLALPLGQVIDPLGRVAAELARIEEFTGLKAPSAAI